MFVLRLGQIFEGETELDPGCDVGIGLSFLGIGVRRFPRRVRVHNTEPRSSFHNQARMSSVISQPFSLPLVSPLAIAVDYRRLLGLPGAASAGCAGWN